MGDETKENELEQDNTEPLRGARKPSTADAVDKEPADIAQVPKSERELPRNDSREDV